MWSIEDAVKKDVARAQGISHGILLDVRVTDVFTRQIARGLQASFHRRASSLLLIGTTDLILRYSRLPDI